MPCRYRAGDEIVQLGNWLVLLSLTIHLAATYHKLWLITTAMLVVLMGAAAYINNKSRRKEMIQEGRVQRQLALGVPPDEIGL